MWLLQLQQIGLIYVLKHSFEYQVHFKASAESAAKQTPLQYVGGSRPTPRRRVHNQQCNPNTANSQQPTADSQQPTTTNGSDTSGPCGCSLALLAFVWAVCIAWHLKWWL